MKVEVDREVLIAAAAYLNEHAHICYIVEKDAEKIKKLATELADLCEFDLAELNVQPKAAATPPPRLSREEARDRIRAKVRIRR